MSSSNHPANKNRTIKPPPLAEAARNAYDLMGEQISWDAFGDIHALLFNDDSDIEIFIACLIEYSCFARQLARLTEGES